MDRRRATLDSLPATVNKQPSSKQTFKDFGRTNPSRHELKAELLEYN